jgi:transcriptional regulator with XRE-family HTH domain
MDYSSQEIGKALREARVNKLLSQRELSALSGVPQGHISKIEKGAVDLRLSSLIALARVLDLEPTLVPRQTVPAVQSIVRSTERPASSQEGRLAAKELKRLRKTMDNYFSGISQAPNELAQLQRQIRDLQHFQLSGAELESVRSASQAFKAYLNDPDNVKALHESLTQLKNLRNRLAHGVVHAPQSVTVRPAYALDEDDNA